MINHQLMNFLKIYLLVSIYDIKSIFCYNDLYIFSKGEQRLDGAIVLHFLGAIYFFTMCGLVINNYFMPAIQCFCDDLHISSVYENYYSNNIY